MMMPSRFRGLASLDALLSLLPFSLMLVLLWGAVSSIAKDAEAASERQRVFDRTVSVADYTVKAGAVRHEGGVRYPNWVDPSRIDGEYVGSMRERSGLTRIHIGLEEPQDGFSVCIYRLVVVGDGKDIRKLHVCGG